MKATRNRKAPQPVHGSAKWIGGNPTQGRLDDGDAILQITAAGKEPGFYHVETNRDGDTVRSSAIKLIKIDGLEQTATYDVDATGKDWTCDCPDAVYVDRPNGCKHSVGLRAALKAANLL